ncbi:MAG: hypothetical protein QNJ54_24930 [Prochloraceae cyanobacterium]|nr:hypothetical protein [Prochloraceae cyanobacterium]
MKHFCDTWIQEWCEENGWTDLFIERYMYWAFPPGAVIPEPIPPKTLRAIKAQKGFSDQERLWSIAAVSVTIIAAILSYLLMSPMPLVLDFIFVTFVVVQFEIEQF